MAPRKRAPSPDDDEDVKPKVKGRKGAAKKKASGALAGKHAVSIAPNPLLMLSHSHLLAGGKGGGGLSGSECQ